MNKVKSWTTVSWLLVLALGILKELENRNVFIPLDQDKWMRFAFLRHAMQTDGFWGLLNYHFPRDGAPWGMDLNWTLPYDLWVVLTSYPLIWLGYTWTQALEATMPYQGPVMFVMTCLAIGHLMRAINPRGLSQVGVAVAITAPGVLMYALIGRVNHHTMTLLIVTLMLSFLVRTIRNPIRVHNLILGFLMAVACWQSMETLPGVLSVWGIFMLAICIRKRVAKNSIWFLISLLGFGLMIIAIDPSQEGTFSIAVDRYSGLHFFMFIMMALSILVTRGMWRLKQLTIKSRIVFMVLSCFLIFGLGGTLLFLNVNNAVDVKNPIMQTFVWNQVMENKSVFSVSGSTPLLIFPNIIALPVILWGLWSKRGKGIFWIYLVASLLLVSYIGIGITSIRLSAYSAMLSSVILALAFNRVLTSKKTAKLSLQILIVVLAYLVFVSGYNASQTSVVVENGSECFIGDKTAEIINNVLPQDAVVASDIWLTPLVLWKTHVRTYAGPYHRNRVGLIDLYTLMASTDDKTAQKILVKRQTKAILVCGDPANNFPQLFLPDSLQHRLVSGDIPAWLSEVKLDNIHERLFLLK